MIVESADVPPFLVSFSSAVSAEGAAVRRSYAAESSRSITIDERYRQLRMSLENACREASVDDWDGMGARRFEPGSFVHALRFIESLPLAIPSPDVYVEEDGEVAFDWDYSPARVLSISIGRDGTIGFASAFDDLYMYGIAQLRDTLPKPITLQLAAVNGE